MMGDPTTTVNMAATSMSGSTSSIVPTSSDKVMKDSVTDTKVGQTTLHSSYDEPFTDTSQFPMQHATEVLPSNQVPMTTTEPVTFTSDKIQSQSQTTQLKSGITQSSPSVLPESDDVSSDLMNTVTDSQTDSTKSSDSQTVVKSTSQSVFDESVSLTKVNDETQTSAGGPDIASISKTVSNSITPTDSTNQPVTSSGIVDIVASSSGSSTVMSGQIHGLNTATETTFSSAAVGLDSVSLKTTHSVPLPPLTGKPMVPETSGDSTILGGGLPDIIVYAGVPGCGLVILILLIVCIICIRRRKAKAKKGSPAKNRVQDLWVNNSRSDVPLTSQNTAPEPNGGEAILQDDIGCTTYEAVFDYKGELSTHLQLKQGDLVRVHRKEAAGWWRGTVGDQTGWFPSNYVQPAPPDNFKTENEVDLHDDSHVTSFMLKKTDEPNQRQSYIVNEPNHRISTPTEQEIEAEPIYCKIQPKDKRKSGTDRSNSTTPTKSDILSPKDSSIATDTHYVALYPFVARVETELSITKGDLILCKECTDKNGWMRGVNDSTKQEGWVPATYVKKLEVEKVEKPKLDPDPTSYKQLEVNTNMDERQDLVGIVHRAVHTFCAEKAGDLEFDTGDLITVFQVLENGWWLGCKDKTVGWFPGSFVEMIDQPSASPSPSPASSNRSPSESPVPSEDSQLLLDDAGKSQPVSNVNPVPQSKLKPVRKAPAPPKSPKSPNAQVTDVTESPVAKKPESKLPTPGGSRLPKMSRPKVAPPLPPSKSEADDDVSPLYDTIDKNDHVNDMNRNISDKNKEVLNSSSEKPRQITPVSDGLYELIKHPDTENDRVSTPKKDKIKPPVPKRYIKPKLVTVPKAEVQMVDRDSLTKGLVNGDLMRLRSPPPPRPVAPKLGPIRAKLAEPKPLEDQIPSEEEDTFFNVTPQRKFDAFVCQELSDQETEVEVPYQRLSSFGSFGGSTFGKPKEIKTLYQGEVNDTCKKTIDEDKEFTNNNKPVTLKAPVQKENVQELETHVVKIPNKDQNMKQKDVRKETEVNKIVPEGSESKNVREIPVAESEPHNKTGIPVTPKAKASRLAPPKSVSVKASEPHNVIEPNKTPDSPAEKPSKLQKPTKLTPSSKIPLSPKDSPRKKVEDSHVFQYPETSPQTNEGNQRKLTDVSTPQDYSSNNKQIRKDDNTTIVSEHARPRTESLEKRSGSETYSENRLRADSVENRPETDSVDNRPRAYSVENRPRTDSLENRSRTDSIGKPPVAPKPKSGLPKLSKPRSNLSKENSVEDTAAGRSPVSDSKSLVNDGKSPSQSVNSTEIGSETPISASPGTPVSLSRFSESESDTDIKHVDDKPKSGTPGSKIPLGSALTQQSPKLRGRKSNLPSPGARTRSSDRTDKSRGSQKTSESESDGQTSPGFSLQQKSESPRSGRKPESKQISSLEKQSLRNRSNSPAGRSGIPTKLRNRSNSPAPKQGGIPVPVSSSGSKSTPKNKQRGLVPPKKILNGQEPSIPDTDQGSSRQPESPGSTTPVIDDIDEAYNDSTSPKPDRPSKPPRVQKQKSHDGKPPKHGKSLLPVIHKSMESAGGSPNGVTQTTPGTKPKRGIPVAKPARPPAPKSPPADLGDEMKRTLYQAVKGYTAQIDGELTFSEGTFVKELSDCDRPGWYVGMLADGTTGLYPGNYFKPSPVSAQSEA